MLCVLGGVVSVLCVLGGGAMMCVLGGDAMLCMLGGGSVLYMYVLGGGGVQCCVCWEGRVFSVKCVGRDVHVFSVGRGGSSVLCVF